MQTFLVTGVNETERIKKCQEIISRFSVSQFDIITLIPHPAITIEDIRLLKKKINLKPYASPFKTILIMRADKLTLEAQNAILKTLEEPPKRTIIILEAQNTDHLLPTVCSRCQTVYLGRIKKERPKTPDSLVKNIFSESLGEKLLLLEKIKTREELAILFENISLILHQKLLEKYDVKKTKNMVELKLSGEKLIKILRNLELGLHFLESNLNPKLVFAWFLLETS